MTSFLTLDAFLSERYSSPSQKIKIITESWVSKQIFCPACGATIAHFNKPVCDYICRDCSEEYELKSKKNKIGGSIVNGAYSTMISRLTASNNPNLFLLSYQDLKVYDFFAIPKYFFIPAIIEKRKPLSNNARRAGWIGCNILLYCVALLTKPSTYT